MTGVTWVIDSSSLMDIKSKTSHEERAKLYLAMTAMANEGRLKLPRQVIDELKRGATSKVSDPALEWALKNEAKLCDVVPSLDEAKEVMSKVGNVIDHDKDSGEDEADPYVLALALKLRRQGIDARIVTEERKDRDRKISMNTAAGELGIPPVPLRSLMRSEGIS
jgi:hypothetical protein